MSVNQLLEQFLGGQKSGEPSTQTQPENGLVAKAGGMLNAIPGGMVGGLAAGSLFGLVAGNKKVRKTAGNLAGSAASIGGAAALGALAFKAYQSWQGTGAAPPTAPVSGEPEPPAHVEEARFEPGTQIAADGNAFPVVLIKAMIAASNADGHIDGQEQAAIFSKVEEMNLDASDKALIFDTLQNPPSVQDIANLSAGVEQACEIYLVSRMAIDPDQPSEQMYLQELAEHLSLPDGLAAQLEQQLVQPQAIAA